MRLVDADKFLERVKKDREHEAYLHSWTADMVLERLDSWYAPTIEAIPKAEVRKLLRDNAEKVSDSILDIVKEEYIPKTQYENRLKADLEAMLTEILTDFDNLIEPNSTRIDCESIIEQKIQALEGKTDGEK